VAWFLEARRTRILNCCLIDPVSIMLHHADVCDRFLYGGISKRAFKIGRSQKDLLMQWLVREETGIVLTLMRNFWWYKNTAWLEDLSPIKSTVLLGLADEYAAVNKIVNGINEFNERLEESGGESGGGESESGGGESGDGGGKGKEMKNQQIILKTYRGVPHGLFLFHKRMQEDMLEALQRK